MWINIQTFRIYIHSFNNDLFVFALFSCFFVLLIINNSTAVTLPNKFILVIKNSLDHFIKTKLMSEKDSFQLLLRE